jgi:hypothetical protein
MTGIVAIGPSIKSKVARFTRLDNCGNPVNGPTGQIVTAGYTKIDMKAQLEAGTEFLVKDAWGDFSVNDLDGTRLKRYSVEVDLSLVDPSVYELTCGYRAITDATGNVIGNAISEIPGSVANSTEFSLETWSKVSGAACGATGWQWIHWLLPAVQYAYTTDVTLELGSLSMMLMGNTTRNANYQSGPYNQWLPVVGAQEHLLYQFTNTAPPVPTNGYGVLAAPTGTAVAA